VSSILTLTLNPALDISLGVDAVVPNHKIRTDPPRYDPGGGGLNVSRVCRRLGEPTTTVAPVGGPPGQRMLDLLTADKSPDGAADNPRIVPIQGDTRQSVTVLGRQSGDEYRFVLPGPTLSPEEIAACLAEVLSAAESCRCLVISGSMPEGVEDDFIEGLVGRLHDCRVIVDTSGSALKAALTSGAYLVKPSARELASLVEGDLITEADVTLAAHDIMAWANIEVLVVSIGAGGAIAVTREQTFRLRAPTVQVRSAVGAGDSMVAGIAVGLHRGLDLPRAVALGIASGTAAVLTDGTELCHASDVERLLPLVQVN
jgi:6-phosphofructokinase 2